MKSSVTRLHIHAEFQLAEFLSASNAIQIGDDSSPKQHVLKLQKFGVLGLGGKWRWTFVEDSCPASCHVSLQQDFRLNCVEVGRAAALIRQISP